MMFLRRSFLMVVAVLAFVLGYGQIQKIDSLRNALLSAQTPVEKIEVLTALSEYYIRIDFSEATSYATKAIELANTTSEMKSKSKALTQRALLHWRNGEYDSSVALNEQAIGIRKETGEVDGIAENNYAIAMNFYYSADYDLAISFHKYALEGFEKIDNHRRVAEVLNLIGLVYHQMGNYPEAIKYFHKFSEVRKRLVGYQGRTYNMGNTSPFFRSKEYFENELKLQLKALHDLKETDDEESRLFTYLNVADSYKELGDYENALVYHKKAAQHSMAMRIAPEYNVLGNAYRTLHQTDSAIAIHKKALQIFLKDGPGLELLHSYISLGKDYEQIRDYTTAMHYYKLALKTTTGMNNKLDMVINNYRVADMYSILGRYEEALPYAIASLEYARKINAKTYIRDAFHRLASLMARLNRLEEAYFYQIQCKSIADSLTAGEAELQYAQMQAEFELEKKEEDIALLNSEKERQQAVIRNKDQLIVASTIVLLLSILLGASVFLRFRQKNRANKILQEQKNQIETLLAEIHHRVKNNLQVISSLLSIQSDQLKNKNAKMAVLEGQSRVQAMGLIHENIYKAENFAFIDMDEYLNKLSAALASSFGMNQIIIEVNTDHRSVDVDTAIPLGLIVNELITNSLKHAFNNVDHPRISINLHLDNEKILTLKVIDNGRGFQPPSDNESFGLRLVKELAAQLGGTMDFVMGQEFCIVIRFRKFKVAA